VIVDDINKVSSATVLERAGQAPGEADILIGGPPCQPFSKSAYWVRGDALRLDDPRSEPRVFLLENPYGLAYEGKDEALRYILDGIAQISRETGTRCEARDGRKLRFPEPTHVQGGSIGQDLSRTIEPYRTAWDALGDLREPDADEPGLKVGGKWGDLLPTIPEGENYLWHTDRSGGYRGYPLFGWRTRY
jgi:DNA (cytosine-5)-methyltransferase 1